MSHRSRLAQWAVDRDRSVIGTEFVVVVLPRLAHLAASGLAPPTRDSVAIDS